MTWINWEDDVIDWSRQPGWEAWKYSQYAFNHDAAVNQSEARQQCQHCGGDLASVANLQEHQFIVRKL